MNEPPTPDFMTLSDYQHLVGKAQLGLNKH
jgi:hypothetical protein